MSAAPPTCDIQHTGSGVQLHLAGTWQTGWQIPAQPTLTNDAPISLMDAGLQAWDSSLPAWLLRLIHACEAANSAVDVSALPMRLQQALKLARSVPNAVMPPAPREPGLLAQIGNLGLAIWEDIPRASLFLGELWLAFMRLLRGRARMRMRDFWLQMELAGPRALPIVSLISFLVGTILAYMGAIQLAQFGAQIYIADLVAIGMVREIAALMTGVILAGRTGASFAAQLGTMQVGEEIDALRVLGIPPVEHLVLPRMLALLLMMPLLTLYAGMVGILAGMIVANLVFNVGMLEYWIEALTVLNFTHVAVGLVKACVYGALIAFAGCLRGMQCGRSAQAVGEATTSAMVTSILLITIFASLLTILFQKMGL